ncbi:MAG: hypothetical protein DI598_07280 [Pseudopedobacter saltans]|uniref:DUF4959 domain-containing protein n=1 Tax=Pseudopedobacter saltans TaxID=151895 RepID=A0A2W5F0D8_9SPHI|nr:MAG: hypothetical protein DI598_07280 [Pseudopedobacter saltans]
MRYLLYFTMLLATIVLHSCKKQEGFNDVISSDKTKPGVVTNVTVTNGPGRSVISYSLPNSENLLYVRASYKIDSTKTRQSQTSYYTDTIVVDGFAESKDYTVTLTTITRANIESDPVTITVHPDTPPYMLAFKSLTLDATFGGAYLTVKNTTKQLVGTVLLKYDSATKKMLSLDQYNSADSVVRRSVRGYAPVPYIFGACIVDRFGNSSDTIIKVLTPIPEVQLDRTKFSAFSPAYATDATIGWAVSGLWNGNTTSDGGGNAWRALGTVTQPSQFPLYCTFSLGVTAKLSRFKVWQRGNPFSYANENSSSWSLWGSSKTNPADAQLPKGVPLGTVVGDWINLGNFVPPPKPSGLPLNSYNAADDALVAAGFEYDFSPDNPPVRCIRYSSESSFSGDVLCIVREIAFWGQVQ